MRRGLALLAMLLALWPLAVPAQTATQPTHAPTVVIGSKNFTESVVLGEIARLAARDHGAQAQHRRSLGGTRILWRALTEGDIDAYPEYTGTITHELLRDMPPGAGVAALRQRLKQYGIGITDPLGFNNTYAIGMLEAEARTLHIRDISDLARHPDLKLAFSNEFMNRADGWPGLKKAYHLPQNARGMDHALAYRALASGALDAIDLYSTDANIDYYHVRVLKDNLHYFPHYDAVYLYRLDLKKRAPKFVAALKDLAGTIDAKQMRAMNKAVKIDGESETAVAARFLGVEVNAGNGNAFWSRMGRYTLQHLALVGISLSLAILLAVPLGIFAARYRRLGQAVLGMTGILQTVPSLALFVFMIPLFGIGAEPAIAALFLYSLLPIVRNTHAGLTGIQPSLLESAAALGLPPRVRLWRVELPLALRSILAGVKIAAVINVGTATLGALIGSGGYGQPILTGIRLDSVPLIMEGAIPAALLALVMQGVFELIERALTPRGLRLRAQD
ncbi:MAG TPA: glycine betaine ABC transporter substrate-binding protein [Rhodanobacteraceae bacterium]|nr:glycine betaine ABC transporter substrate-binding protein [Rhodanobacteraceae bacterium]